MRTFVGVGLKGIMILLFLLALLDPDLKGPGGWFGGTRVCTLFVLDRSESISSEAREDAERLVIGYMKGMSSRDRAGLVVFGKEPQVTWLGENDGVRWPGKAVLGETDGSETHGARALSLSASLFPEGFERHVVFFSDGRETGGPEELEAAAARLALDGIVLHGVPLGGRKTGLFLKNLRLPGTVQPGVPFSIRVAVEGKGTGELGVYRNGVLKARKSLRKDPPAVETTSFTLREEGTGYVQYEAVLQGAGATTPVQRKGGIIRIEGPLRVLYVDGKKSAGGGERPPLATLLHDEGLPVEWVSPEALSGRLSGMSPEWGAYGLVVFDDLPLPAVPPELLAFLPRYVHDLGGGFLMVGGEGGFGPGGYGETAVETLMPVRMKIPAGARTEGMELILLLDKSGSMDEGEETRTKWDRAVEAAASAMKVLRKGDAAGVIAFDGEAHEIVPLARNPDLEEVGRRLRGITPGGGTDIAGGLDKALAVFSAPDRGTPIRSRRHLILLSDGKTQRKEFAGIFRRLNQREVTVSVIAIGEDPDTEILKTLTAGTGGRFYRVMERDLPAGVLEALFRRDTLAASEQWIVTESFRPRLRDPLDGVEKGLLRHHGELPPMKGYVRTTPKKSSRIVLESDRGDPIIAAWHYGAGRSAALTTDGTGRWSGVWLNWPPFQETFGGLARWILAPRREGAKDPGREAWERIFLPETREETGRSPDYLILTRITEMTGGRFLRPEDNPFHPEKGETPSGGTRAVCLPAILVLFLVDVGYHRRFGMFSKDAG